MIRILRLPEVRKLTGLSRASVYRLEGLGEFPRRVRISERARGWLADEIQAWVESRPRVIDVNLQVLP